MECRPDRHCAFGGVRGDAGRWGSDLRGQSQPDAGRRRPGIDRGAILPHGDPDADRLHRIVDAAGRGATWGAGEHQVPDADPEHAHLQPAARGGDHGLLRSAEEPIEGLREHGIPGHGIPGEQARPGGHQDKRRDRGAAEHHLAPRQGLCRGEGPHGEAKGGHPAPDVQGAHPSLHRGEADRKLPHSPDAEGRAVQVLRRRHLAKEEAVAEASEGKEEDESHGEGERPAGGLLGRVESE
mmetsp:Transcript_1858/g.8275  ORF Transcript_1858/g.8275 Transcript_1858/m.8275 type:complete len:239 (-) Transcript_1858:153-869(-)|eukprot:scaffold743_cov267-Pinguiococcus_pyrenoidosus.AAC.28